MRVLLFADAPAGDGFADRLRKLGADVEYVRNPHPKRIIVGKGFAYVVAMNARGLGAQIKEAARASGAKFLTVPPGWAAAQAALEESGLLRDLVTEKAPRASATLAFAPAPAAKPRARTWEEPAVKPAAKPAEPSPVPPAEPAKESPPVTTAPTKPGPSKEATAKGLRIRQFLAQTKVDWAVNYLRHNPWAPNTRVLAALRRRFGTGLNTMQVREAREQAKVAGALPPSAQYPDDPTAVVPATPVAEARAAAQVVVDPKAPAFATTDSSAPLSPETRAALDLAREALRKEPGLVEFSLTLRNGKWNVNWGRTIVVTQVQAGTLSLED